MSSELLRNRALKRIKALLNKTEENGATIEEAKSSISKANQLMKEYYLTINDIESLEENEVITTGSVDRIKIKYRDTGFLPYLSDLFDCKHFYNKKEVTFVGYDTDVKICIYLYKKITSALINDISVFKKTRTYEVNTLYNGINGRTLVSSFVSGFINGISNKMYHMFCERESNVENNQTGLMVIKSEKVSKFYDQFDVRTIKQPSNQNIVGAAFVHGEDKGQNFNLNDDLDYQSNDLKKLNG